MFNFMLDNDGEPVIPEPTKTWKSCGYCHKHFPPSQMVEKDIWENGERKKMLFCSDEHAIHYQTNAKK